jgi:ADP-ribose pyrophosphatase YjhB (NUDIX family)
MSNPKWLEWARQMQSIAQAGLTYSENPYDHERYEQLRDLAAEIIATYAQVDLPVVKDLLAGETGYLTPKIDVRGVVFQDGKLLLVKESSDGGWTLPGGWGDVDEPPSRAVEREVWEESGYQVQAKKILALYDRSLHGHPPHMSYVYKIFILCELQGGAPVDSLETSGASFFASDSVPPLSLQRTTAGEVERMFAHHAHPDWPTDFD